LIGIEDDTVKENLASTILEESIKLFADDDKEDLLVAVVCGEKCAYASMLGSIDSVDDVVTLSCPSMVNFNEFEENASEKLATCEKSLVEELTIFTDVDDLFDYIVIDSSADKVTASILLKIFESRTKLTRQILSPQVKFLATYANESEKWRINLLKLIRNKAFYRNFEFSFYSEVVFNKDTSSMMKLLVTTNGEEHFVNDLKGLLVEYEKGTGMVPIIENFGGGMWHYQDDFVPSKEYTFDDYDSTSPLDQWKSQVPLGHQVVFQLEPKEGKANVAMLSKQQVLKALELAMKKTGLPVESPIEEYCDAGDGCVLMSVWANGSVTVLWNGKQHVDINLFMYKADDVIDKVKTFEKTFLRSVPLMMTRLRDEHPRGVGRVVSYWDDIEEGVKPYWA